MERTIFVGLDLVPESVKLVWWSKYSW